MFLPDGHSEAEKASLRVTIPQISRIPRAESKEVETRGREEKVSKGAAGRREQIEPGAGAIPWPTEEWFF